MAQAKKRPAIRDWYDLPGNEPETLDLPIGGTVYTIAHPSARVTGNLIAMQHELQAALRKAEETSEDLDLDADTDLDIDVQQLYKDALGDAYEQMLADERVPAGALQRAFQAVQAWAMYGTLDAAEAVWEGKDPTVTTRQQRRSSGTRSPASGSGTGTTRKSTPAKKAAKAPSKSRGSTSGKSGRS